MGSFLKALFAQSFATFISRILGFIRDVLIARYFEKDITDPFFIAQRIPNLFRRFFAEGGLNNVLTPFLVEARHNHQALTQLIQQIFGLLLVVLSLFTIIGIVFSSFFINFFANGLLAKESQFDLANSMLKITFAYILFISLTALSGAILNSNHKYAVASITPVFLNISLILAAIYKAKINLQSNGLELAWAVLLGGVLQLFFQLPFLLKMGLLKPPKLNFKDSTVRQIIKKMLPNFLNAGGGQISILINTFLASGMITGSISWLYYADRLTELPIALIGVAVGNIALTNFSENINTNINKFLYYFDLSLKIAILLASASAVGLIVLSPVILLVLFYGGQFYLEDVINTSQLVQISAISVFFLIIARVFRQVFFAQKNTALVTKTTFIAIIISGFSAFLLAPYYQVKAIAIATNIHSIITVILLVYFLIKNNITFNKNLLIFLAKVAIANLVMFMVLSFLKEDLSVWLLQTKSWQIWHLIGLILIAVMVYFSILYLLGIRIHQFKKSRFN